MISGVVLAAGTSSRLGRPKQLLPLHGRPLLQHVVDAAAAAGLDEVLVVLGHGAAEVEAALRLPPAARTVGCPDYREGQSASLRTGLAAAAPEARAAVVLLGDQPTVDADAIRAVIEAYGATGGPVVQARYDGRPGHPVLLDRRVWGEMEKVRGDRGARDVLVEHAEWVVPVDLPGEPPPDVDTRADYERLVADLGHPVTGGPAAPPPP